MEHESGIHLWLVLFRAARAIEKTAFSSVSRLGIDLTDFAVLEVLLHKGPQPVNLIGRKVLLSSGSITAAVDRLQERGLVLKTTAAQDRRSRIVELTAEGKELIEHAFTQHALDMEETMSVLSPRRTR